MVSTPARVSALIAVTAALSVDALAQRMLVNVRDAALKTGAAGAVVTVVERETGAQVYGLTNDAGRASIRLPSPGVWAASVRRIGVAPASAAAVRVDSGQSVTVSIVVNSVRFTLPGVRVSVAATCGRAPRGDDRAATLWEQVSLALRASALTRADSADAPALWVGGSAMRIAASLSASWPRSEMGLQAQYLAPMKIVAPCGERSTSSSGRS